MATRTEILGLVKPGLEDDADIRVINANMDILDKQIGEVNSVQKYKASWFDSVESMKAEPSLTAGAYVCTAGYYEHNDGGGASYLIRVKADADVDDGGSLHYLSNDLVAELIIENGTVNVKQFGAKGDGVADDTEAIKKTILYAKNNNVIIGCPHNVYKITDTILIDFECVFKCFGTIKYAGSRTKPAISLLGAEKANIYIHKITDIIGDAEWHGWETEDYIGFLVQGVNACNIKIDAIYNFTVGFAVKANAQYTYVTGCIFDIGEIWNTKIAEHIVADGAGTYWINSNRFKNTKIQNIGNPWYYQTYPFDRFGIRKENINGCTYPANSNRFENFAFEDNKQNNGTYTMIYLEYAQDWCFSQPRIELSGNAQFAVMDAVSVRNITIETSMYAQNPYISLLNEGISNAIRQQIYNYCITGKEMYSYTNSEYYDLCELTAHDILNNTLRHSPAGSDYNYIIRKYRFDDSITKGINLDIRLKKIKRAYQKDLWINQGYVTIHNYGCIVPLVIEVKQFVTYEIRCNQGGELGFRIFNTNKEELLDLPIMEYISGDLYRDGNKLLVPNENKTRMKITVKSDEVKYLVIFVDKLLSWVKVRGTSFDGFRQVFNFDDTALDNIFVSDTKPTYIGEKSIAGTRVYKEGDLTTYWEIEKQADGSLTWVTH